MATTLAIFKGKEIRHTLHNNEWWYAIVDVVEILTDSAGPRQYMKRMRQRDPELNSYWGTICTRLLLKASDGKMRKINCVNTEGIFRIIQSIPSPKAEPFKRWLAKVGYERVQEIDDPELATKRTKTLYRTEGYSEAWIEKRMRGIAVRAELTDEWQRRGIKEQREYAILKAEISEAAFGVTLSEYKEIKGLRQENLRDHMTDLKLIFSMLGEAATTEIARKQDVLGFSEIKVAVQKGKKNSGDAREKLKIETEVKVVSPENYLTEPEARKRLDMKMKSERSDEF